jgi:predicted RND superfamily exporter protein
MVARSTIMGVLVAGLTTIAGFGGLMLADHRGIYGLGLLLTLGTTASLIASLIVLPVLLRLRQQRIGGPTPPEPTAPIRIVPTEPAFERGG